MQKKHPTFRRAPSGVVTGNPVLMRLMPDELATLRQRAQATNTSLSACARDLVRRGLHSCDSSESVTQNV